MICDFCKEDLSTSYYKKRRVCSDCYKRLRFNDKMKDNSSKNKLNARHQFKQKKTNYIRITTLIKQ